MLLSEFTEFRIYMILTYYSIFLQLQDTYNT